MTEKQIHEDINEVWFKGSLADVVRAARNNWHEYSRYEVYFHDADVGELMLVTSVNEFLDGWLVTAESMPIPEFATVMAIPKDEDLTLIPMTICLPLDEWISRQ